MWKSKLFIYNPETGDQAIELQLIFGDVWGL